MVKEGPCCHCGIENTPLWRNGPPAKPVLCNACGSRWRVRGTLDDYIPKHALVAKEESDNSGSHSPSTGNVIDLENTDEQSGTDFENVPRRKRSSIDQVVLSPIERFHKQLYDIAHAHSEVFLKEPITEDVLIQQINSMMSTPDETPLGVKLLSLPPKLVEPTESMSSSNMKAANAFLLEKNGGDRGESSSTRDITDPT